jgi:hypothetical protein
MTKRLRVWIRESLADGKTLTTYDIIDYVNERSSGGGSRQAISNTIAWDDRIQFVDTVPVKKGYIVSKISRWRLKETVDAPR